MVKKYMPSDLAVPDIVLYSRVLGSCSSGRITEKFVLESIRSKGWVSLAQSDFEESVDVDEMFRKIRGFLVKRCGRYMLSNEFISELVATFPSESGLEKMTSRLFEVEEKARDARVVVSRNEKKLSYEDVNGMNVMDVSKYEIRLFGSPLEIKVVPEDRRTPRFVWRGIMPESKNIWSFDSSASSYLFDVYRVTCEVIGRGV